VVATGADERQDEPPTMKKIKKMRPAKEFKLGPMLVYAASFVGDGLNVNADLQGLWVKRT
tara:strand:- start:143 stop:322 length:180 start_codon:yes stop_codon:yes gene_type:complete